MPRNSDDRMLEQLARPTKFAIEDVGISGWRPLRFTALARLEVVPGGYVLYTVCFRMNIKAVTNIGLVVKVGGTYFVKPRCNNIVSR